MSDVSRPDRKKAARGQVNLAAGVPTYHDYRQQGVNRTDAMRIKRGTPPEPCCGAGKGYRGIS